MKQRRNTRQRQLILEIVQNLTDHPSADEIYAEVKRQDERIGRATVYRNLSYLAEEGEITHVKVPGADRYDCRKDFHYHLVCSKCRAVMDAPVEYDASLDEKIQKETGYVMDRHRTIFEGLCKKCQQAE